MGLCDYFIKLNLPNTAWWKKVKFDIDLLLNQNKQMQIYEYPISDCNSYSNMLDFYFFYPLGFSEIIYINDILLD